MDVCNFISHIHLKMIIYGDKINTPLEWSLPGEAVNKSILYSEDRGERGGSLRASAYCHGAKCSMTILSLPESWG